MFTEDLLVVKFSSKIFLSIYATLDQLRNEIDDLLNITSVDKTEVVVFFRINKDD